MVRPGVFRLAARTGPSISSWPSWWSPPPSWSPPSWSGPLARAQVVAGAVGGGRTAGAVEVDRGVGEQLQVVGRVAEHGGRNLDRRPVVARAAIALLGPVAVSCAVAVEADAAPLAGGVGDERVEAVDEIPAGDLDVPALLADRVEAPGVVPDGVERDGQAAGRDAPLAGAVDPAMELLVGHHGLASVDERGRVEVRAAARDADLADGHGVGRDARDGRIRGGRSSRDRGEDEVVVRAGVDHGVADLTDDDVDPARPGGRRRRQRDRLDRVRAADGRVVARARQGDGGVARLDVDLHGIADDRSLQARDARARVQEAEQRAVGGRRVGPVLLPQGRQPGHEPASAYSQEAPAKVATSSPAWSSRSSPPATFVVQEAARSKATDAPSSAGVVGRMWTVTAIASSC